MKSFRKKRRLVLGFLSVYCLQETRRGLTCSQPPSPVPSLASEALPSVSRAEQTFLGYHRGIFSNFKKTEIH